MYLPFCLAFLAARAAPLVAQVSINGGLTGGYYRPLGHFDPASVYSTALPKEPSDLSGIMWGGAVQVDMGTRLGAEGQVLVARSTIAGGNTPAGPVGPTNAQVVIATIQGQYDVSPRPTAFRLVLSGGPGLVRHGGDAYARYGSPMSVAGAASVSLRFPVASRLQVTAGATTLMYMFDLKMPAAMQRNPGSLQHGRQTDAILQLGIRWTGT